jgi:tetratricopeptide (TPR) repeat protein
VAGRRAVDLDPNYIFGWTWLSLVLSAMGRIDEARVAAEAAQSVDPLSPMPLAMAGWTLNAGRRFEEAEQPLRRALELNPRHGLALWNLGVCLVGLGRPGEAAAMLERANDRDADGVSLYRGIKAWVMAVAGRVEEARADVAELREWMSYRHVPRFTLAWTLAAMGDLASALDEFERSVAERDAYLMYPLFPGNDPLRKEPRFQRALKGLGLEWAIES